MTTSKIFYNEVGAMVTKERKIMINTTLSPSLVAEIDRRVETENWYSRSRYINETLKRVLEQEKQGAAIDEC